MAEILDGKLARGLARQFAREIEAAGEAARREDFSFAMALILRGDAGRRISGPDFNVPLAALARRAAANPATVRFESERLRLGAAGRVHRQLLLREPVRHFRGGGREFAAREWLVAVDEILVERGRASCRFWSPRVLLDQHLIERLVERSGKATASCLAPEVDVVVPLAAMYLGHAHDREGILSLDAAFPAQGGAFLGGIELVGCEALGRSYGSERDGGGTFLRGYAATTSLQIAVSVRTYMDDALLDAEQREAVAGLAAWLSAHGAALRADRLAAYGWGDNAGDRSPPESLLASFAPLCTRVQAAFSGWRRRLSAEGYPEVDFSDLSRRLAVPPPPEGRLTTEEIRRAMRLG